MMSHNIIFGILPYYFCYHLIDDYIGNIDSLSVGCTMFVLDILLIKSFRREMTVSSQYWIFLDTFL